MAKGYKSGFEKKIADDLRAKGIPVLYETRVIRYVKPEQKCRYTPDFILPNGIIIETKGRFVTADRLKHLLVKAQHPELDIRFVFSDSSHTIGKLSETTYAVWCKRNGFLYADKRIPDAWLNE